MASSSPCSSSMAGLRDPVDELPGHLIPEILSWLPAESLARCKCVCKEWLALIQDHHFLVTMHLARSTPRPIRLQDQEELDPSRLMYLARFVPPPIHKQEWLESDLAKIALPETVRTVDIFSGLLLQRVEPASMKLRLWNPTTGKILDLPTPPGYQFVDPYPFLDHVATPFIFSGYHAPASQHKLVTFYRRKPDLGTEMRCAVLTVGEDRDWREVPLKGYTKKIIKDGSRRNQFVQTPSPAAVHFVTGRCIHSFDIGTEKFHVNRIYNVLREGGFFGLVGVFRWDNRIGLCKIVGDAIRVLVLEDYKMGKWRKEEEVHLKFLEEHPHWREDLILHHVWPHKKMLFVQGRKNWFTYNPAVGTIDDIGERLEIEESWYRTGVSPSLVEFHGMRDAYSWEDKNKPFFIS